jgi:hypothetical protein
MYLRKKDGAALVVVILLLSVFTVLASGFITLTLSHYKSQKNETSRQKAFYIAEACLEETRAKVLLSFQAFLNGGTINASSEKFSRFLASMPSIINDVTSNHTIRDLGADNLTGNGSGGNNLYSFSYTATCNGMAQTLHTQYVFDDPATFFPGDRALDKVVIVWRK